MKGFNKKMGFRWVILMVLVFVGVIAATGCSQGKELVPILQEKTIDATQISTLHITTEFTRIRVVPSSSEKMHVLLHGQINANYKDQITLRVHEENQQVHIQVDEPKNYRNLNTEEHQLEIEIPQRVYENIMIKGNTAVIDMNGVKANHFEIDSAQGNMNLRSLEGNTVNLISTIGHVTLESITGNINVRTEQGNVTFVGNIGDGNATVATNVSDIDFTRAHFPKNWETDLKTVQGTIEGTPEQFTFSQQMKQWKGNKGTGGPKVEVSTKQGNIRMP